MPDHRQRRAGPAPTGFSTTGRRTALGYWLPLAVTVTVAAVGLAAWVWSERNDDDDDDLDDGRAGGDYDEDRIALESVSEGVTRASSVQAEDSSVISRVQGALRRTPSPSQLLDGASRRVVAGVSAAGAVVGGALSAIREESGGNGDFEDHSRWAEPAPPVEDNARRADRGFTMSGALPAEPSKVKRRTVAIVVSSVPARAGREASPHEV
jgi:hypothetical protein